MRLRVQVLYTSRARSPHGPHDSVIGMRKDLVMDRFVHGLPHPFRVAKGDPRFQGVLIEIDRASGNALSIERVDRPVG